MWFMIFAAFAQADDPSALTRDEMKEIAALCPPSEGCEGAVAEVSLAEKQASPSCNSLVCSIHPWIKSGIFSQVVGAAHTAPTLCSKKKADVAAEARQFVVRRFRDAGVQIGYLDSSENLIMFVGPAPVPPGAVKASYQVKIDLSGIPKSPSSAVCSVKAEARRYILNPPSSWKPGADAFASKLTHDFYTVFYGGS